MKVRHSYCNYEWVKRKYDRHMYAQFRSRQDLSLRGKIATDFESVALTTRPRLPGYKYCSCISKKWRIERFRSTDVSICRKIIYSLEGLIFGKYRKNTCLKFLSQTTLWWAERFIQILYESSEHVPHNENPWRWLHLRLVENKGWTGIFASFKIFVVGMIWTCAGRSQQISSLSP